MKAQDIITIELNGYQIANLKSALEAIGYGRHEVRNPLWVLHTGDWVGEIYWKLPHHVEQAPNFTPEQLEQMALKYE